MTDRRDRLQRAEHLLELRRPREAERELRAVLLAEPEHARALRLLALALHSQGREQEAMAVVDRAVAADPGEEHGHRLRSIVAAALGRPGDSLASAQEAVRLAPYVWQTHYQLAMALRLGRRPRTADALAAVDEALRLAPHESQVHNLAGICLDELGRRDEAVRAYEESLRLDPTSAFAMNNLAADRLNRGKLAAASRMLTSGLSADPQQRFLHQNFDAILISLVSRLFVALMQFGILLGILAMGAVPYALRVAFVVAMLAVFGLLTWRVVRHLPRRSLRRARGLFRRSRAGRRALLVVFAVLTVCVVAVGLAPATIAVRIAEVVVGAMPILLLGVVVAWLLRAGLDLLRRR